MTVGNRGVASGLLAAALFSAPFVTAHGQALNPNDLPQKTAEPPVAVPATTSCTETVLTHTFKNSYYAPGFGTHTASACPGPWSVVVLDIDVSVSGVQFDRIFDAYVGPVLMFSSSTSEPASLLGGVTHWHVESDVSRFAGLLASDRPITIILNNVNDSTYTGQYQVTAALKFYATGADAPAAKVSDVIIPILPANTAQPDLPGDYGGDGYAFLTAMVPTYQQSVAFPRNLVSLHADLYAQGHGACEEFWWAEPSQCGVGTPLRQIEIAIDGTLAGFAPVYPVLFTGGGGPGSWNPIPSPRAWHLDPYRIDLTPFVARLVDGAPHVVSLGVPDAAYSDAGDFWLAGATLLGNVDRRAAQTKGELTLAAVAPSAQETLTPGAATTGAFAFTGSRSGTWSGYVIGAHGRVDTTFSESFDVSTAGAVALTNSTWHWTTSDDVARAKVAETTTVDRTYVLRAPPAGGGEFEDAATIMVDGPHPSRASFDLDLRTVGAVEGNLAQVEAYQASDSSGHCYHRELSASGGHFTSDQSGLPCAPANSVAGPGSPSPFLK